MARWTWHAADLATGANLGALPVVTWSHTDTLNDSGGFTATMAAADPGVVRAAIAATAATKGVVMPVRNGVPLGYAGIVWRPDQTGLELNGAALLSWLDAQTLDVDKTYASVDQHLILKDLVTWVQTQPGGNIQIDTSQIVASGVLRDQTWLQLRDQKNIGEAFRQKGDNLGGFDFDLRVEVGGDGNPVRRLRMWTPRRGNQFRASTAEGPGSPVFTVGRNAINVPTAPADGAAMATYVIALGKETNPTTQERRRAISVRTDLLAAGYTRLVRPLNLSDVDNQTTLQSHADGSAYYDGAVQIDQIVLEVDPDDRSWPWGSWDLGDDCRVVIPSGVDSDWPDGFNQIRRIIAHQWAVDANGETLQVVTGRPLGA